MSDILLSISLICFVNLYTISYHSLFVIFFHRYSNYMDINSLEEEDKLSGEEIQQRLDKSREILVKSGAHYVIDSITDLPEVCADINQRLAKGEQP